MKLKFRVFVCAVFIAVPFFANIDVARSQSFESGKGEIAIAGVVRSIAFEDGSLTLTADSLVDLPGNKIHPIHPPKEKVVTFDPKTVVIASLLSRPNHEASLKIQVGYRVRVVGPDAGSAGKPLVARGVLIIKDASHPIPQPTPKPESFTPSIVKPSGDKPVEPVISVLKLWGASPSQIETLWSKSEKVGDGHVSKTNKTWKLNVTVIQFHS